MVCNFTPVPRANYLIGVPSRGVWHEILNTDAREYGGSGWGNLGGVESVPVSSNGRLESVNLNLPPLATIILRRRIAWLRRSAIRPRTQRRRSVRAGRAP